MIVKLRQHLLSTTLLRRYNYGQLVGQIEEAYPLVPPTNNHAERMIRPAVIIRKLGGCNKTPAGAKVHSVLASLMVSCRQQGKRFLDLADQLFHAADRISIPLASLPDD